MRGIFAAAVAALAACALLLPSCASGEATVLPLAGGEAAVSEDGATSGAEFEARPRRSLRTTRRIPTTRRRPPPISTRPTKGHLPKGSNLLRAN